LAADALLGGLVWPGTPPIGNDSGRLPSADGSALGAGDRLVEVAAAAVGLESVPARATAATETVPATLASAAAQVSAEARR
jgi:hypothetical protein